MADVTVWSLVWLILVVQILLSLMHSMHGPFFLRSSQLHQLSHFWLLPLAYVLGQTAIWLDQLRPFSILLMGRRHDASYIQSVDILLSLRQLVLRVNIQIRRCGRFLSEVELHVVCECIFLLATSTVVNWSKFVLLVKGFLLAIVPWVILLFWHWSAMVATIVKSILFQIIHQNILNHF